MIVFPRMFQSNAQSPRLEVKQINGKFGIVRSADGEVVLPYEYDNIFKYSSGFVLCQRGKWGAVTQRHGIIEAIVPCEYDAIECDGGDWIFSNQKEILYCFLHTGETRTFQDLIQFYAGPYYQYLFAKDDKRYYIIEGGSGKELWSCPAHNRELFPDSKAGFFRYLGRKGDLPLFFDLSNHVYILPCSEVDRLPKAEVPELLRPIVVNGNNIVNILNSETGLKVSELGEDFPGDIAKDEGFDEATVEVKVTLKSEECTIECCYPIPDGTFFAGEEPDWISWE